ncbi:intraflagellar transport protein 46-like isoform 1, partial [Chrysochromulina tobinii]
MSRAERDDDDRDDDEFSNPDDDGNSPMGRGHGGGADDDFDEFEDSVAGGGEPSPGGKGSTQVLKNQTYDEAMDLSESDGESLQPSPPYDEEMELSSEGSVDDRDDDDGGSPDGGRGVDPATSMRQQMNSSGLYDPAKYANLPVSAEIKELFQHITRYKAHNIELETRMRPFIPDYIPAVGDIDPFIKIPRPDGKTDNL